MKLRWRNVPIPEAYLVALGIGGALEFFRPQAVSTTSTVPRAVGAFVLLVGLALAVWSVATVGEGTIEPAVRLITTGPYRYSRNPMYLAWALIAMSIALLANSVWLLGLVPLGFLYLHLVDIPREEAQLHAIFGEEYESYKRTARRYL